MISFRREFLRPIIDEFENKLIFNFGSIWAFENKVKLRPQIKQIMIRNLDFIAQLEILLVYN